MASVAPVVCQQAVIALSLASLTRDEAILHVTKQWLGKPELRGSLDRVNEAILERENLQTTAVANGVAFPHARTEFVSSALLAVGVLETPVRFGHVDVWLVVALASPVYATAEHLEILSWLARRCSTPGVLEALRNASSVLEFRSVFLG